MITIKTLRRLGFKEIGNKLGAAHYTNGRFEIRHTQENNRYWLTDGKLSFDILGEITTIKTLELLKAISQKHL
jgi:hypothetical protein